MSDPQDVLARLQTSDFRRRQQLGAKERSMLGEKTLPVILEQGRRFLKERLAPAEPPRDGRQTPWRGHPIFIAQHATATCCRGCLARWHQIPPGRPLTDEEIDRLLALLSAWLQAQMPVAPPPSQRKFDW